MESIKLIEGKFTPDEAKEVLLDIIASKIRFHNLKCLSSEERFSKPNVESGIRLKELEETREYVLELTRKAKEDQCNLVINSVIRISLENKLQPEEVCSKAENF